MGIRVQESPFDAGIELNTFAELTQGAGALVTFTGIVRSSPDEPLVTLTLECYPELALAQIGAIVAEARARFDLIDEMVIHRYGALRPGEAIMQVMTLAAHRQAAFDAAQFLMDYLKTDAPFWKKEATAGGERWVDATSADDRAKARWS